MGKKQSKETLELRSKTDQELMDMRRDLGRQFQILANDATKVSQFLSRIKNELRRRRTENEKPFVSDHAVLRYLSRVEGVDIELIRHKIAMKTPDKVKDLRDNEFENNGVRYLLSKDGQCITTVVKAGETDEQADSSKEAGRGSDNETSPFEETV